MSEQNPDPTPSPTEEPPDPQDVPTGDVAALSREAAKWRRQLRETEQREAALEARLDDHDKREVERIAAERMADPEDVWLESSLDAMRDDGGALDAEKVAAELGRINVKKPHWMKQYVNHHQGARASVEPEGPSFGQSVKKALGG